MYKAKLFKLTEIKDDYKKTESKIHLVDGTEKRLYRKYLKVMGNKYE